MTRSVDIAPLDEALTFARTTSGQGERLIAVRAYQEGQLKGVDLSALQTSGSEDAIDLINRLGQDAVRSFVEAAKDEVEISSDHLGLPIRLGDQNIGVGTNYAEHAAESTVVGSPFLFPKIVQPTAWDAPIPAGDALLDYEVELCLVPLEPLMPGSPVFGGLILGNDVTDRAVLLRNVDVTDPQSGKGFTSGKSGPNYMPVGDLFVVPRNLPGFISRLTLHLSVNGQVRQHAAASDWIWDLEEIVRQCRLKRDVRWAYWGGEARLAIGEAGEIPARTVIMAGTPAGTVFHGVPTKDRLLGALAWLLSGRKGPLIAHVIERHIKSAHAAKTYLQPGDRVDIRVDRLGCLSNPIVASL
jgi:2-keto-4-pentenoate hydratase/2-oxohepta-3-ene-1,7-dioic acid hydratase in catechol pathway